MSHLCANLQEDEAAQSGHQISGSGTRQVQDSDKGWESMPGCKRDATYTRVNA